MIKNNVRLNSILNEAESMYELFSLPDFPVFMGVTEKNTSEDCFNSLIVDIGGKTGVVQIRELVDQQILYGTNHAPGTVGRTWAEHHSEFCGYVLRFGGSKVLELGAGSGELAKNVLRVSRDICWTIYEPSWSSDVEVNVIREFFSESTINFIQPSCIDTIISSHFIEHLYDPQSFFHLIGKYFRVGTKLICSIPDMRSMLERCDGNLLNFEHTFYLDLELYKDLLQGHGFEIHDISYFKHGHSIFITASLKHPKVYHANYDRYIMNRKSFEEYFTKIHEDVMSLNKIIQETNGSVYIFGAHVFTQILGAFGLNLGRVVAVLDNDATKIGKRLYGTKLIVFSPSEIRNSKQPVIILRMGSYSAEIKAQLLKLNGDAVIL